MAIKRLATPATSSTAVEIPNLKAGQYMGRLRYVADLGMQVRTPFQKGDPERPDCQQLSLGIEVIGETVEIDGEIVPRLLWMAPFNVFHNMTPRGKELQLFKVFDVDAVEDTVADWDAVINGCCTVTTVVNQGKGANADRSFTNIKGITPIMESFKSQVGEGLITDGCTGDCEDDDNPAQARMYGLPESLHAKRVTQSLPTPEPMPEMAEAEDLPF